MEKENFQFAPDNLLDNLNRLGPWSQFALAEEAIYYYYPRIKRMTNTIKQIQAMADLCLEYDMYWVDWIITFQMDKGYKRNAGFSRDYINEW
jgi:hypothetical protein